MTPTPEPEVHYTVFVRLPFPRGDFIDPPPANWNLVKDRALWEILSQPSKGNDIDWKAMYDTPDANYKYMMILTINLISADDFNVTLPFLLQQAAWLYDRQLSQVRAQMLKVGNTHSQSPSPAPGNTLGSVSGSGALGGQAMRRAGSGVSRTPSRLSAVQKESQPSRVESSCTAVKAKAPSVRTNSANTVTQTQITSETIEKPVATRPTPLAGRLSRRERPSLAVLQHPPQTTQVVDDSPPLSPASDTDSDLVDDDNDDEGDVVTSRRFPGVRRFGKYSMHKPSLRDDLDDDDDDSPAFLPLPRENEAGAQHMNSTLRQQSNVPETSRRQMTSYTPSHRRELVSLDSSASSGVAIGSPRVGPQRPTEPFSPRRVANLSRQSSRQPGSANQSSEETPSMGSSFSDLDDASVTQSALEEALLSNMQHGGMASRMSTISQALRSRYL
ncbi:multidomain presynaptic cytomatrix related protein [Talaromyces stipitatus ATCC 10500]|uniref:Autophagy-related protein 29 n=1 Tax=Talaromyces stipitatus (strain ATCC 10500 / CBS 375.48 / QM 6759 / NRRL 1006) TaxID=441959 RepID=B8MMF9_TALSN|nr:multidomain presynaptic cytomatrix related protein [Talaromyces stipitatus ATCC 10500]EED13714.1 multidomain presynaptic cytomatrix related protein [Talaromyces stipitatus ATCC 10500]